jgi:thymidylate synthase
MAYSNSTPQIYEDKKKSGSVWSWIGKQLMKPVGVASQLFGAGTDIVGGAILPKVSKGKISYPQSVKAVGESLVQRGKNIADVVTGKKTTSFQEQYIQNKESVREGLKKYYGVDLGEKKVAEKFADGAIGLSADLVLDPLNKFSKIKPAISAVKTGVSNVSEKVLSNTGRFGESIKNVSEKLKESVASVFNPETSIPEFNAVVDKFRNLRKYQEGLLVNKASQMGKDITNYAKQTGKTVDELNSAITNLLENPAARELVTDKTILSIVDDLKYTYSDFLSQSKNVGLSIGEIVDYAPTRIY